jgi:hypothetical protein
MEPCSTGSSICSQIYGRWHIATETESHILCMWLELRVNYSFIVYINMFMEPSDYEEILLRNILCFVRSTGLLAE